MDHPSNNNKRLTKETAGQGNKKERKKLTDRLRHVASNTVGTGNDVAAPQRSLWVTVATLGTCTDARDERRENSGRVIEELRTAAPLSLTFFCRADRCFQHPSLRGHKAACNHNSLILSTKN